MPKLRGNTHSNSPCPLPTRDDIRERQLNANLPLQAPLESSIHGRIIGHRKVRRSMLGASLHVRIRIRHPPWSDAGSLTAIGEWPFSTPKLECPADRNWPEEAIPGLVMISVVGRSPQIGLADQSHRCAQLWIVPGKWSVLLRQTAQDAPCHRNASTSKRKPAKTT